MVARKRPTPADETEAPPLKKRKKMAQTATATPPVLVFETANEPPTETEVAAPVVINETVNETVNETAQETAPETAQETAQETVPETAAETAEEADPQGTSAASADVPANIDFAARMKKRKLTPKASYVPPGFDAGLLEDLIEAIGDDTPEQSDQDTHQLVLEISNAWSANFKMPAPLAAFEAYWASAGAPAS